MRTQTSPNIEMHPMFATGQETTSFEAQSGVRQGDNMSPTLFNYAIDFVLENALRGLQGVQVGEYLYLTDLTYANDIALLGDSAEAVQDALNNIDRFAKVVGLRINASRPRLCQRSHVLGHNTPSTLVAYSWRRSSPSSTWALPSRQRVRLKTKSAVGSASRAVR